MAVQLEGHEVDDELIVMAGAAAVPQSNCKVSCYRGRRRVPAVPPGLRETRLKRLFPRLSLPMTYHARELCRSQNIVSFHFGDRLRK